MTEEKFFCQLNKVISLMKRNKLREDIDDTLLEKLLSLIKENIINECYIENLIKSTEILVLCEKSLFCLISQSKELSSPTIVFSVRLLGMMYEKPSIFIAQKCSLASSLSNVLHSNISISPSVQDAILASLFSIGSHPEGALWLLDQNLLKFIFKSFSSTSYYVRKTASNFFPCAFKLWTSSEWLEKLPLLQQNIINDSIEKTVSQLISDFNPQNDYQNRNYNNCCILALKQILQIKKEKLFNISFLHKIMEYFESLNMGDNTNQDVIDLLLLALHSDQSNLMIMKDMLKLLMDRKLFPTAFHLASSFLKDSEAFKPMSCNELALLLIPLCLLSETNLQNLKGDIFLLTSNTICSSIVKELEIKSKSISLISSSLQALSTLTQFMNEESASLLLASLKFAFSSSFPEEKQLLSFSCLENRMICLSLLELFSSFLNDQIYVNLNEQCRQMIFHYLLQFLQRPSTDCNILSEAINLMNSLVMLNAKHKFVLDSEAADELIKQLCRKLLDNKEPVVDSALHLANEIINGEGHDFWKQFILKDSIHLIIWDIAVQSFPEGFIKASALKVITEACLNSYYLEDIKSRKTIDEMDIMKILINYVQDPDFFVQREAVVCACKWLKSKEHILPSLCKDSLFLILSSSVKSLDLELKLIALDQWKLCVENHSFFPVLSESNLKTCWSMYCSSGFSGSLMLAVDDSEEAVKYKSATIMLDLREKLTQLGLNQEYLYFDKVGREQNPDPTDIEPSFETMTVTIEERDKGIDSVMNISTAQQLLNICRVSDCFEHLNYTNCNFPLVEKNSLSCSVECFWSYLWSKHLNDLLSASEQSASMSTDYALSLLDDIIAAEITHTISDINDVPDCY